MLIKDKFRELKWFYQRGKRGFSDYDLWDMDDYLLEVLPEMLKKFRSLKNSYPMKFKSMRDWQKVLKEMETGFRKVRKLDQSMRFKDYEKKTEIFQKNMKLLTKHFFNLWD